MFNQIDHVGIVVANLDESLETYRDLLGFTLLERMTVPEQKVDVAFLDAGNGTVELIAPTDTESGTARFLHNRGEGPHHVCFAVEDIAAALVELEARGVRLIDRTPRHGVHGLVAFVHPKAAHGTLIELLQRTDSHPLGG
jgi:methylmalonyl-CoA/ethylmalonyl-CoA epimerase